MNLGLVGWLFFYGVLTLFGWFNAESNHFDEILFQSLLIFKYLFMMYFLYGSFYSVILDTVLFLYT